MAVIDELLEIDRRLAAGSSAEYERTLHERALVIVPGAVMTAGECVTAMASSPGWDDFSLTEARVLEYDQGATLVYGFEGRRDGETYRATLTSRYVFTDEGWKLLLHQHTPQPDP